MFCLDEVQEATDWEHVANSLLSEKKSEIYLTGSNSQMLSSELATYIAGRYIEIPVSTLSFSEALAFRKAYSPTSMGTVPQEINFIAEKMNQKIYVQVAYKMADAEKTISREFSSLLGVRDHYPKYVVTMDDFWKDNIEGIKHVYLPDFLLMSSYE